MSMVQTTIAKTPLILKVVSLYVVIASVLWTVDHYVQAPRPVTGATTYKVIQTKQVDATISGQPAQIKIERLGITLPILDGAYNPVDDSWTLTDTAAHFATMTTQPNNKQGNTFIYGHNTQPVFEPVKDIVAGDLLTITTTNGHVFNYTYVNDVSVTPDQTSVLNPESALPKLTLMTCEGIFSETRRIMHFDFIGLS